MTGDAARRARGDLEPHVGNVDAAGRAYAEVRRMQALECGFHLAQFPFLALERRDLECALQVGDRCVVGLLEMIGEADRLGSARLAQGLRDVTAQRIDARANLGIEPFALLDRQVMVMGHG